ncbi:MAG: TonB-dependent receptor [Bacteroidota bacterium]
MRNRFLLFLVLFLAAGVLVAQAEERYELPRRVMPLEKALLKLTEAGGELSYRPDQIPQIVVRVPGGRRTLPNWLSFLLKDTELTFAEGAAGYLVFVDARLSRKTFTVYGHVRDGGSGELLLGAAAQVPGTGSGAVANEYGYYSLSSRGGRVKLRFSYIGYEPREYEFVLRRDTLIDVGLVASPDLPAVVVRAVPDSAKGLYLTDTRMSIGRPEVSRLGGPGGEADPLRIARLLPGVETGADGLGGIFVRGGEAGHNLVLLDGVPVYNLDHGAGLFSIFSNQAIRRADLYRDGFPARFGGRIGAVLDVHTRDGNLYENETTVGSSMLAAHFASEGPIEKGESSFLVTGRYFWIGELLRRASTRYKADRGRAGRLDYQVYDVNFKLNQQLGDKGRLYFSFYKGLDNYDNGSFQTDTLTVLTDAGGVFRYSAPRRRYEEVSWGNTVAALRYNHIFNDRFFGNFRISYTDLLVDAAFEKSDSLNNIGEKIPNGDILSGRYGSDIKQFGAAFDGGVSLTNGALIRFGSEINFHRFLPQLRTGKVPLSQHPPLSELGDNAFLHPVQFSAYASLTGRWKWLHYRLGLRGQNWYNEVSYTHFSPRLLLAGELGENYTWRVTYDHTVQPVHLVSNTVIGLPTDLWVPSTRQTPPSTARQLAFSFTRRLGSNYRLELAGYHRRMDDLVNFAETVNSTRWLENLSRGEGEANGVELTLSRTRGRLKGWVNYTFANSRRQFDGIVNAGRPFPFRYGREHAFKWVGMYELSPSVTLSANWRWGSGAAYSISGESLLLSDPAILGERTPLEIAIIDLKNGFIFPSNHRLDVNAHITFGKGAQRHVLDVGIYNVYNRHNPIYYDIRKNYFVRASELIADRQFVQVFLAPITPTLAYHLTFGGK